MYLQWKRSFITLLLVFGQCCLTTPFVSNQSTNNLSTSDSSTTIKNDMALSASTISLSSSMGKDNEQERKEEGSHHRRPNYRHEENDRGIGNKEKSNEIKMDRGQFLWTVTGLIGMSAMVANPTKSYGGLIPGAVGGSKKGRIGGLANKIRSVCKDMDELQRDLMQERWDLVEAYPPQLRSYVPVFTTYTDAAFPSDAPSDYGLRVALRYEVGRFFGSLERFKRAAARKSLDEAYTAYADMSLHLDRYLRVGGLYTYYDSTIDNEPLFQGYNDALIYSDPVKDPPEVRDLIVLRKGPDTGKTGIVIGIYRDGSNTCVVKLDKYRGMREVRVVPISWAAKRLGEQDPDDVFLIPRK